MATGAKYGQIARYNLATPTLTNGTACALQVGSTGTLNTTVTGSTLTGAASKGKRYGQLARYNTNLLVLTNGTACALQVDVNGNLIIA